MTVLLNFSLLRSPVSHPTSSLRWITTLLSREFSLPDTLRLWDSLFAVPSQPCRNNRADFEVDDSVSNKVVAA